MTKLIVKEENKLRNLKVIFGAIAAFACISIPAVQAEEFDLGFLGAGPSSVGYQLAAGIAENTNKHSERLRVTAETTGGYIENVRLVVRDTDLLGFTGATQISQSLNGVGAYEGEAPYTDQRGVAVAYAGSASWNAREGIEKIEDLVGKSVSVGPPGSNIAYLGELVLEAYGIKDQVNILRLSYAEGARGLVDGTVDAFMGGPAPYPSVVEAGAQTQINILPLSQEAVAKVAETTPVIWTTVPSEAYDWLDEDVPTIGYLTYIIAHKDTSRAAIDEFLKANLNDSGIDYLKSNHRLWSIWDTPSYIQNDNAFSAEGIKLHPAAAEYWQEQGVVIPDSIQP